MNGKPLLKEKDRPKKKDTIKKRKSLHKQLWDLRSKIVRIKANGVCYTCGVNYWDETIGANDIKQMQAGHFRHNVLDFDPENIRCQCVRCNKYLHGNASEYARKLVRELGPKKFEALCVRADKALKGELYSYDWYVDEIAKAKAELLKLNNSNVL